MMPSPTLAIILAAGQGTRMKSRLPKVMHPIAGRPMIGHAMEAAAGAAIEHLAIVTGPDMEAVANYVRRLSPEARLFTQHQRLGTAHAVLAAEAAFANWPGAVIVLYGDTPLVAAETIRRMLESLSQGAAVAVLGFEAAIPTGYGRLLRDESGRLAAIREEKDANDAERAVTLCNSGVMGFQGGVLADLLGRIGAENVKGEYYLTDAIGLAYADGLPLAIVTCPEEEVMGVNDRAQLAQAEAAMQNRLRWRAMEGGATLIAPGTVTLAFDTKLAQDVLIEPNVFFGPGVTVEDGAIIRAFSHIVGAHIGTGAQIGPYARLRPGARLGESVRVGNFVEIKNAEIEENAKINHLTYIGDARVGAGANVGAGTITCNYDGFSKHHTDIGAGAFIGSNSALVAPVKIGDGAYIGSGSVISRDVAADALAVARPPQTEIPGWAARTRARRGAPAPDKT